MVFGLEMAPTLLMLKNNIDGSLFSGITVIEVNSSNKIERVVKSENALYLMEGL